MTEKQLKSVFIRVLAGVLIASCVFVLKKERNRPTLTFRGVVLDQSGEGVPGVEVRAIATLNGDPPRVGCGTRLLVPRTERLPLRTDSAGRFEIIGPYSSISLDLRDNDAVVFPAVKHFRTVFDAQDIARSTASLRDDTIVFNVWRKMGSGPLIKEFLNVDLGSARDNRITIDLLKNRSTHDDGGGDVRVDVHVPGVSASGFPDSVVTLEAVNGGIQEADDPFLYLAPESDYVSQWHFDSRVPANRLSWRGECHKKFYIKSRSGAVCAALMMSITYNLDGQGRLFLEYVANPRGSRNLEFDVRKRIYTDD